MTPVRLTIADYEQILAFDKRCFPSNHWEVADWKELLLDPKTFVYAMKDKTHIVAFLALYDWGDEADYIKIMTLATHPDFRRQGLSRALLQYMLYQFPDKSKVFKAETRLSNHAMQALFREYGFEITERIADYYDRPTEDALKVVLKR